MDPYQRFLHGRAPLGTQRPTAPETVAALDREDAPRLGRGGRQFSSADVHGYSVNWPGSVAANITSHPVRGVGRWSDAALENAITRGVRPDGRVLQPPMAVEWYANLRKDDLQAIIAWLRTLPPRD